MSSDIEFRLVQVAHSTGIIRQAIDDRTGWSLDFGEGTERPEAQVEVEVDAIVFNADFADLTGDLTVLRLYHGEVLMAVKPLELLAGDSLSVRIGWRWSVGQYERV